MFMAADGSHIDQLNADEVQHVNNGVYVPHIEAFRGHLLPCLGIGPNGIG